MRPNTYYRGVHGKKYGIWDCAEKEFKFGICEDTPMLAQARLYQLLGANAKNRRFEPRMLPNTQPKEPGIVTDRALRALEQMGRAAHRAEGSNG